MKLGLKIFLQFIKNPFTASIKPIKPWESALGGTYGKSLLPYCYLVFSSPMGQ